MFEYPCGAPKSPGRQHSKIRPRTFSAVLILYSRIRWRTFKRAWLLHLSFVSGFAGSIKRFRRMSALRRRGMRHFSNRSVLSADPECETARAAPNRNTSGIRWKERINPARKSYGLRIKKGYEYSGKATELSFNNTSPSLFMRGGILSAETAWNSIFMRRRRRGGGSSNWIAKFLYFSCHDSAEAG